MNNLSATSRSDDASVPLLQMRNVSKTFGTLRALNQVELSVFAGEVHSLMGENGAGKSTLMKILSGAYTADPGAEILINGEPIVINDPTSARNAGIAVIYQELSLSQNLTVAENIYLGREIRSGGRIDRKRMSKECEPVLQRLGAHFSPDTVVSALSIAERQLVEIARAINFSARVIVMDEPTTTLSIHETERLLSLIEQLKTEGLAIIYISHRMAEIYELSDQCSVLRDGSYVGTLQRDELNADSLVSMMVGRDLSRFYKKDDDFKAHRGPCVLRVMGLEDGKRLKPCTFDLHAGEVLGVAGLVGSGRTELARAIYGANHRQGGKVELAGKGFSPKSPKESLAAGVAYLTEDRKRDGLFLGLSVTENVNLNVLARDGKFSTVLNKKTAVARARDAIDSLSIRVSHANVRVGTLSGGNQQKVLLSRLLQTTPRVLILDEPTRGVDIGAKEEIYRLINKLAASGVAVLVISSELPEIVGIAHRVLVMREGNIAAEIGGETGLPITQETIISYATGAAEDAPSETLAAEGD